VRDFKLLAMFKKNITSSNTRQLGGKDAKKFKGDVAKHYPNLTEDEMTVLLPPKVGITLSKLSNRSIVYGTDDGVPLFFDPTGHGDKLIPTVRCNFTNINHIFFFKFDGSAQKIKICSSELIFFPFLDLAIGIRAFSHP
jgi:Pre-PUA-like domain